MRMTVNFVHQELFSDLHFVKVRCLIFRLRALCHRLQQFGFENWVNQYEPRELVMMSALLNKYQHDRLLKEAHEQGDDHLKAWLEKQMPHLFRKQAA